MTRPVPPGTAQPDPVAPGLVLVQIRALVSHLLGLAESTTDQAGSAEAALELVRDRGYDVVLVDLLLPGGSGLDLIAELPAGTGPVPVLLTGPRDVEAVGEARGWRVRAAEHATAVWEATFDSCPDVLLVLDARRQILKANQAAARAAGMRPRALAGRHVRDAFPAGLGEVAAGPPDGTNHPAGFAGQEFQVSVNPLPNSAGGPAAVVVVARNVTALVRSEQDRYRLAQRIISAQEEERGRVSRELHDGVGQAAVSLALGLAALAELVPAGTASDLVRELGQVAGDAADDVRRISHRLRPPVLDDHGLPAALAQLTGGFRRTHGVRAELILTPSPAGRLPPAIELALYRIAQEGLANVARHASARTIDVLFDVTDGVAHVAVVDDGAGFVPADDHRHGLGLGGMRERAEMLGGTFRVSSVVGRGTTIDAHIPVPGVIM